MGIINSVLTLFVMAIVAINMASQPIIGFNFGAKSAERVKGALRISIISATLISISAFVLIQSVPGFIVKLFNNDSRILYDIATKGLHIVTLALPIVGFQVVASNFFQSVGKAKLAMFATLFRQVITLIPLLYIFPGFWEINGIWIAFPVSDSLSALAVTIILFRQWTRLVEIEVQT